MPASTWFILFLFSRSSSNVFALRMTLNLSLNSRSTPAAISSDASFDLPYSSSSCSRGALPSLALTQRLVPTEM